MTASALGQSDTKEAFRIDFAKLKAPDDDTPKHLADLSKKLAALKGKVGASPDNLLAAIQLRDQIDAIRDRSYFLEHLRYLLDTTYQEQPLERRDPDSFLEDEVASLPGATLAQFYGREPGLRQYAYDIDQIRRQKPHRLSVPEESALSYVFPKAQEWEGPAFENLRQAPQGKVSEALHAVTLVQLSKGLNEEAKLRGFRDAVDSYCFDIHLETAKADRLLANLHRRRDLDIRFEALLKRYRAPKIREPKFTIGEAVRDVRDALTPLGPEYGTYMEELLDPKNGRVDLAGGPHRSGLGTGWAAQGLPSILYWPEFTGDYDDLDRGISHEGGHAIHYSFMRRGNVTQGHLDGPGYLFESFAELNQILLADYLYRNATSLNDKIFFLEKFLEKADYPLYLARYPDLEFAIHRGIDRGEIRTAKDFFKLEKRILKRWGAKPNPKRTLWMTNETFYTHPIYNINHMLGSILAIAYYSQLQKDPVGFVPRYTGLLRKGIYEAPDKLLKDSLGIDLGSPKLVDDSLTLLGPRIAELAKLYKERALKR